MKNARRMTTTRCLCSMNVNIIDAEHRVTMKSPILRANGISGMMEKIASGRGSLKMRVHTSIFLKIDIIFFIAYDLAVKRMSHRFRFLTYWKDIFESGGVKRKMGQLISGYLKNRKIYIVCTIENRYFSSLLKKPYLPTKS